jgi:hypothetical protein
MGSPVVPLSALSVALSPPLSIGPGAVSSIGL